MSEENKETVEQQKPEEQQKNAQHMFEETPPGAIPPPKEVKPPGPQVALKMEDLQATEIPIIINAPINPRMLKQLLKGVPMTFSAMTTLIVKGDLFILKIAVHVQNTEKRK